MNYKDNSSAQAGDMVSGTNKNGEIIKGTVVESHRYFLVASEGKLIGDLKSENFSKVADPAPSVETA